jgi:hypothetical protein
MNKGMVVLCMLFGLIGLTDGIAGIDADAEEERVIRELQELGVEFRYVHDVSAERVVEMEIILDGEVDMPVTAFALVSRLKSLRGAKLTGSAVDDRYVAELSKCASLETVELVGAAITDAGLEKLSRLTRLRRLTLAFCRGVSDRGVGCLGKLTKLEQLDVTDVPGVVGPGLVELRSLRGLRTVNLSWTSVADEGIRALAGHPSLETLVLEDCPVNDRSVETICGLPKVKRVVVRGTKITEGSLQSLRKARPGLVAEK